MKKTKQNPMLSYIYLNKSTTSATITIKRTHGKPLPAPYNGSMQSKIYESLDAHIHCTLTDGNTVIMDDTGQHGGFEIVGDIDNLIAHL